MSQLMILTVLAPLLVAAGPEDEALLFLQRCRSAQYQEAFAQFAPRLAEAMPVDKLKQVWEAIGNQVGPLRDTPFGAPRTEKVAGSTSVRVRCEFTKTAIDAVLNFDSANKLAGLFFRPAEDPMPPRPASYEDPSKYEEQDIEVGAEGWPLKGTLTLPKGQKSYPIVVFVHGSGPNNRDESLGPNAPFKDLAHGLAARGIATLRYDKRTFVYGAKLVTLPFDAVTIDTEVIEDALAALNKARTLPGVDSSRVYLLGHSLGGSAGPAIARRDGKLAGLIILAGANRQPDQLILDQYHYLMDNDPAQAEAIRNLLKELEPAFQRWRAGEIKPDAKIMGAPAFYWSSWDKLTPAKTAGELKNTPILVMEGGKDYQVTEVDFNAFKKALEGRENVETHLYPNLGHLFIAIEGKPTPAEVLKPGHVDPQVITDIATWIQSAK